MLKFFIWFFVLLIGLFSLEILQWSQQHIISHFTAGLAHVCVWVTQLFDADVDSHGKIIRSLSNGFAVEIAPGCNGVEAVIILFAAIFAFPAALKYKIYGFVIGFFAIQGLNVVRIISLFYLGQWNYTWFEWAHLYIWQALIILDAMVVWFIWLRMLPTTKSSTMAMDQESVT